jgi:hypothetical protein
MELPPVAVLGDFISPSSYGNRGTDDVYQLFEASTPALTTLLVDDPLVAPAVDTADVTAILAPPSMIPAEDNRAIAVTDLWPHQSALARVSLFDAPSPLTSMSTPPSESQEPQTPILSSEVGTPTTYPPSTVASSQKRKRSSHKHGTTKKSRRGRKAPQEKWGDVPPLEGSHADPAIWPPVVNGDTQKVSIILFPPARPRSSLC